MREDLCMAQRAGDVRDARHPSKNNQSANRTRLAVHLSVCVYVYGVCISVVCACVCLVLGLNLKISFYKVNIC